jgi:hypothetical protein
MKILLLTILLFSFANVRADDCVRSVPEPIVKKSVFPKTTFKLTENKEYPAEKIGTETVRFNNGDSLVIENRGCETYSLSFRFTTAKFSANPNNSKFWYAKAIELVEQTKKGIRKVDVRLISDGVAALKKYARRYKNPKYDEFIEVRGGEIKEMVSLNKVRKLKGAKYEIEVSFGVGPL